MSPFVPKDWKDWPDTSTPRDAAALEDQETRLSAYTDSTAAALTATGLASARPAANAVPAGSLYVASDTGEVSRSNGSAWTTAGHAQTFAPVTGSERPLYFDFADAATFARGWTVVTGAAPTVTAGAASPANSSEVVVVRAYERAVDSECVHKVTTPGGLVTGATWSYVSRYLDSSNYVMTRIGESSGTWRVEVYKKDGGSFTALATTPTFTTPSTGTTYWVRHRHIGNTLTVEWWTTDPASGGSPAASGSYVLTGGDATKFGAGIRGQFGLRHSSAQTFTLDDLIIRPLGRPPRQRDVQVFTSSGTWTKPAGAAADPRAVVEVIEVSGGSGGGSGPRRASGTQTTGGGGGGGGSVNMFKVLASAAPATSTVTVGAGGAGGASVTTNDTNGATGAAGGNSNVTGFVPSNAASGMSARGGAAAAGGSTGTYGASAGADGMFKGGTGGVGALGGAGGAGAHPDTNYLAPGGGGAGGGIDATPAFKAGGAGTFRPTTSVGAQGGATDGAAGATSNVNEIPLGFGAFSGSGGGGGASSVLTAGGAGSAGGNYGGGGGGGGASLNGNNSGAGGAGGPGVVVMVTEWGG